MRDEVNRYLASVLRDTAIEIARRSEIAEEMRSHIEQSAAARRAAGDCPGCAIRGAIDEFGPATVLRGRLRRRQLVADLMRALRSVRRLSWIPFLGGSAIVGAVLLGGPAKAYAATAYAAAGVAAMTTAGCLALFMLIAEMAHARLTRCRPRDELAVWSRFLRWSLLVTLLMVVVVSCGALAAGMAFAAKHGTPIGVYLDSYGAAVGERGHVLLAGLAAVIATATGMTILERRKSQTIVEVE